MNWESALTDFVFGFGGVFGYFYVAASAVLPAVVLFNVWRWAQVRQGPGTRFIVAGYTAWLIGAIAWSTFLLGERHFPHAQWLFWILGALFHIVAVASSAMGLGRAVRHEAGLPMAPKRQMTLAALIGLGVLATLLTPTSMDMHWGVAMLWQSLVLLVATLPLVHAAYRWRRLRPSAPRTLLLVAVIVLLVVGEPLMRVTLLEDRLLLSMTGVRRELAYDFCQGAYAIFFRLSLIGQLLLVFAFAGLVREEEERAEEAAAAALEREEAEGDPEKREL